MSKIVLIGDVHGKIEKYLNIINSTSYSTIQLGDFGFKKHHEYILNNVDCLKNKVCFGNHDDYNYLNRKHSLKNFSIINNKIMSIRGAFSIDKYCRTEGVNWFSNEEMNYNEFGEVVDTYEKYKPKIVISHECPSIIKVDHFGYKDSFTSKSMQFILNIHKPDIWVFGHHHVSLDLKIDGVRFICLNELETITI
jgi:predicted phosphodiesterase